MWSSSTVSPRIVLLLALRLIDIRIHLIVRYRLGNCVLIAQFFHRLRPHREVHFFRTRRRELDLNIRQPLGTESHVHLQLRGQRAALSMLRNHHRRTHWLLRLKEHDLLRLSLSILSIIISIVC